MFPEYSYIAIIFILLSTVSLFVLPKLRWVLAALAIQYFFAFWLTAAVMPLGLALIKLVVGLMIVALFVSVLPLAEKHWNPEVFGSGVLLKTGVTIIVWIALLVTMPKAQAWFPLPLSILTGAMLLIAGGMLQVGLNNHIVRVCFGLLTFLSGFEMIYGAIEPSVLVTALFAVINTGIGLVGFTLTLRQEEEVVLFP